MARMTNDYHGVPFPTMWENMDTMRRRAWQAGVMSAIGHLGLAEARKLAAELEDTNGRQIPTEASERAEARLTIYKVLRDDALLGTGISQFAATSLAGRIVGALIEHGWGDLSSARIDLTSMKIQYQDMISECNAALRRATDGQS
jgi:hypothetical protein